MNEYEHHFPIQVNQIWMSRSKLIGPNLKDQQQTVKTQIEMFE